MTVAGWCPTQATVRSGVRWSSYRAFLRRARLRDNLHIFTFATVTKVSGQYESYVQIYLLSNFFLHSYVFFFLQITNSYKLDASSFGRNQSSVANVIAVGSGVWVLQGSKFAILHNVALHCAVCDHIFCFHLFVMLPTSIDMIDGVCRWVRPSVCLSVAYVP